MNNKLVILSCYGDGCIENKVFSCLADAQNDMLRLYVLFATGMPWEKSAYKGLTLAECADDETLNDNENGTMWLSETEAYFYCEKTMHEYAWKIQEFDAGSARQELETKLGCLTAKKICDSKYPGVEVILKRQNVDLRIALVEVDQSEENETPVLKAHVYSTDERIDEPIFNYIAGKEDSNPAKAQE